MEMTNTIEITRKEENLYTQNEEFLAKYPTEDAQINYYTDLAMKLYEEFEVDGTFRQAGVRKNVATWFENKRGQMELFRKHPCWCEEAKSILFTQTETREVNYYMAANHLADLYHYVCRKQCYDDSKDMIIQIYYTLRNLQDNTEKESPTISEEFLNTLNCRISFEIPKEIKNVLKVGTKITRLVRKCYEHLILDNGEEFNATTLVDAHDPDDRSYDSFDKYYAKFADALSTLTVKKITLVSLNFLDFMTMSNGNSWSSCHFINSHGIFHNDADSSYHGQYKQGCLSYALDEPSFLLYTLPATFERTDYYRCQKLTRMCCQYKDGVLITGKCYSNNEDNLITRYRQTLQTTISQVEEFPNLWTFSKKVEKIKTFVETTPYSSHYEDYLRCDQKPTISLCKNLSIDLDKPMMIGHRAYCLHCGEELDNEDSHWLQCWKHRKSTTCTHCGRLIEDDEKFILIDGDMYCPDCVFYCEYHQQYEPVSYEHKTVRTHKGNVVVCRNGLSYMRQCQDCGMYETMKEMTQSDGKYYCSKCVKKYKRCVNCGRLVPKARLRKPICSRCKDLLEHGIGIVEKDVYDEGEYVLMKNDVSCCSYNASIEMEKYYPNRVVRILRHDISFNESYNVSNLDGVNWTWSSNCFVGAIQGADDLDVGKTLDEIMAICKGE